MLHCGHSKGSVIVSYQLKLKKAHAVDELIRIMKNYLEKNNGKFGSFEVNPDSIQFSGKLVLMYLP